MTEKLESTQIIGSKIRASRKERGWSQSLLAQKANVSRPTVARLEGGDSISTEKLTLITEALGLRLEVKNP